MIRVTSIGFHTVNDAAHHYVLAGCPVVFESEVAALHAYHRGPASEQFSELLLHFPEPALLNAGNARDYYSGRAPFNNKLREVRFWRQGERAQIDLDGEPVCQVDFKESHIHLLNNAAFEDDANLEVITGPALILLLAQSQIYCLHAGTVTTPVGNIAIIAESGVGKSTLSAHFDSSWQQVSDDILPICFDDKQSEKTMVLADFPQLKLDNASTVYQPHGVQSLDYLLRLNRQPTDTLAFKDIGRTDAMLQIIRHTVATRLFDKAVMKHHAHFTKRLSGLVPMLEMSYPRDIQQLPQLRSRIIDAFSRFD